MTNWAAAVLAAAKKIDPAATIKGGTGVQGDEQLAGSITLSVWGQDVPIGNGPIPSQVQLERLVSIYTIAPAAPPAPPAPAPVPAPVIEADVKFEEPLGSGNWFIFSGPFRFKIKTTAPDGAPKPNAAAVTKGQVMDLIRAVLVADLQPQVVVDAFQVFALKVSALPE